VCVYLLFLRHHKSFSEYNDDEDEKPDWAEIYRIFQNNTKRDGQINI